MLTLYHGTWEHNKEKIINDGYIDNFKISETTEELNEVILNAIGEDLRNGAIYLTDNFDCVKDEYEFNFKVNVNHLNTNLLFVADKSLADLIFFTKYDGLEEDLITAVNNYKKSFIPYKDFLKKENEIRLKYDSLEFLYFDNICLNL